jgi:hypothetical protein
MGNFLAAPITEKETTRGGGNGITFAMSNMQGWRSSMEDAHVTAINPKGLPEGTAVFAVFDGHGGSLAAELASQKLTDVLSAKFKDAEVFKPNTTFDPERTGKAMRDAFMELDAEIKLNLFDKSGVETDQSGCTAVAALVTDTHIIVANAGACLTRQARVAACCSPVALTLCAALMVSPCRRLAQRAGQERCHHRDVVRPQARQRECIRDREALTCSRHTC